MHNVQGDGSAGRESDAAGPGQATCSPPLGAGKRRNETALGRLRKVGRPRVGAARAAFLWGGVWIQAHKVVHDTACMQATQGRCIRCKCVSAREASLPGARGSRWKAAVPASADQVRRIARCVMGVADVATLARTQAAGAAVRLSASRACCGPRVGGADSWSPGPVHWFASRAAAWHIRPWRHRAPSC